MILSPIYDLSDIVLSAKCLEHYKPPINFNCFNDYDDDYGYYHPREGCHSQFASTERLPTGSTFPFTELDSSEVITAVTPTLPRVPSL